VADDLAIYESIAAALAGGREPDLSRFDSADVRAALQRALHEPTLRHNFVSWLNSRVHALSAGGTSVEERPDGDAPAGALPLRLVMQGQGFAEPVLVRADDEAVQYPMRG
jgi:hypothetical protein